MKTREKFKILRFINSNHNWRDILVKPPYNLSLRDDGVYTLIKYNQLFSDFKQPMVQEARGLIVKKVGYKYIPVCVPFTKFFCVGDHNANNAIFKLCHRKVWHIEQKIDGSLIKVWFDNGEWHISTNGTIDAAKASLQFPTDELTNYKELFLFASKDKIDYGKLDKRYTYMFELVGIENKVIVPYEIEDIYYLGRRNNYTLLETPYLEDNCVGVEQCKRPSYRQMIVPYQPKYALKTLQNITNQLTTEDVHFEGYVISDDSLKTRVKMKSAEYMDLSYRKGEGVFRPHKILSMILEEKEDDILSFFPEYRPQFDTVRRAFLTWLEAVKDDLRYMDTHTWEDRKLFADWAKTAKYSAICFAAYGQDYWADGWLQQQIERIPIRNLAQIIGVE